MKLRPAISYADLLKERAELYGTLSRVHGALGLEGVDFPDRWAALDAWSLAQDRKKMPADGVQVVNAPIVGSGRDGLHVHHGQRIRNPTKS